MLSIGGRLFCLSSALYCLLLAPEIMLHTAMVEPTQQAGCHLMHSLDTRCPLIPDAKAVVQCSIPSLALQSRLSVITPRWTRNLRKEARVLVLSEPNAAVEAHVEEALANYEAIQEPQILLVRE